MGTMAGNDTADDRAVAAGAAETAAASEGPIIVWRRWTDDTEVPFHRYCTLVPETWPPLPGFDSQLPEGREPPLSYCPPVARWALRHTPLIVLVASLVYLFSKFGGAVLRALTDVLARFVTPLSAAALVGLFVWVVVLLVLLRGVMVMPGAREFQSIVVYGLAVGLTAGLLLGLYSAAPDTSVDLPPAGEAVLRSFPFDFLWMLLLGGHLVYDGMLRTENMFTRLHAKQPSVVTDEEGYRAFVEDLQRYLDDDTAIRAGLPERLQTAWPLSWLPDRLQTAYLFAAAFVTPFFLVWLVLPTPPESTTELIARVGAAVLPTVLDFFLVVVFFQFLVLIVFFNRLLTEHAPERAGEASFTLRYNPTHHDGYAGFRDLGKFATRVNLILVVGGIYQVYRLSVHGMREYPGLADGVTLEVVAWSLSHLGPLVTYVLAVTLWLYLSFWQIHKTMRRGREREIERRLAESTEPSPELENAPVWPVNNRLLVSVLSMDLVPLLTLLPFLGA